MSTAARKARKRAGEPFVRATKTPNTRMPRADVLNVLFTPEGEPRGAAEVQRDLAKLGTSIEDVARRMGLPVPELPKVEATSLREAVRKVRAGL